jgi:phosphatidylglycerophosphate synthase
VLVVIAGVLFARGEFAWGLDAGWIMTFLDTVDGKLARVTVTSTKLGNVFDHGIDLIHPSAVVPGLGDGTALSPPAIAGVPLSLVYAVILIGLRRRPPVRRRSSSCSSRGSRFSPGVRSTPGSG